MHECKKAYASELTHGRRVVNIKNIVNDVFALEIYLD